MAAASLINNRTRSGEIFIVVLQFHRFLDPKLDKDSELIVKFPWILLEFAVSAGNMMVKA